MNKTEITMNVIKALTSQRETLINELLALDFNLNNTMDKMNIIQSEIGNIDMQISNHLMNIQ